MNELLQTYQISVEFNNVSGAEFLDLLSIRDELTELNLTVEEQKLLTKADQILLKHCPLICQELSRFINLSEYRKQQNIKPQQWWWYLDVLVNLPEHDFRKTA